MTNSAIILNESFRLMREGILSGSGRYVSSFRKIFTPSRHGKRAVISSEKASTLSPLFMFGDIQTVAARMPKKARRTENRKAAGIVS